MTQVKPTKKELLLKELREFLSIVLYLTACLSLVATFKALILIQHGINDFTHAYIVAFVEALAMGKIVVLAQRLKIFRIWDDQPLIWSILLKSAVMTLFVFIGGNIEEALFAKHAGETTIHPVILMVSHLIALMLIFIALFMGKDLERVLGQGTLFKLFFAPRKLDKTSSISD